MRTKEFTIFVISLINLFHYAVGFFFTSHISEDGKLDFMGLAKKYGYKSESYETVTEDGYILKVFRIVGDKSRPVFLMHGSYASSDDFLIRGNVSLCAYLANAGYDVWAGNLRGNRYSRKHVRLNPDFNKAFWDFGIDEHSLFDLPAMLDLVLNQTGQQKLAAIGHSLGTTMYYAMGSAKPEYNDKISVMVSLAPVCFLEYIGEPVKTLSLFSGLVTGIADVFGIVEIGGYYSYGKKLINIICTQGDTSYDLCIKDSLFLTSGDDPDEFEPSFLPTLIGHFPAGTSLKLLKHFSQLVNRGRFAKFDHGTILNLKYYNSSTPPDYDLSQATMKIALLVGKNDKIGTLKNAEALSEQLPNVVNFTLLEPEKWNHIDFTYARSAYKHLFPIVLDILKNNV